MSALTDILFRPLQIGSMKVENRIVMAPMTRKFAPDGIVNDAIAAYYRRRAEGGVGLIVSEGTVIDRPTSRNDLGIPFFHGTEALEGWRSVIEAVHSAGGRMGPQLWHGGSTRSKGGWEPEAVVESPSGLLGPYTPRGRPMTDEAIADTIAAFASAAADAKRLGFDTVEIHGAHGYLIDQFFWRGTNERSDAYGGTTIKERSRFGGEVIAAIRSAIGPQYPIVLRLSQWKQQDYAARLASSVREMEDWLRPLVECGADVLHCSQPRFWDAEFPEIDGVDGLNFTGWAKKLTGAATISVGSVGLTGEFLAAMSGEASAGVGIEKLIGRMEREEFDLVAVGRALISDPHWAIKIRSGDSASMRGFQPADLARLS